MEKVEKERVGSAQGLPPKENFETAMEELRRIVAQMERGDISLEKSLQLSAQGIELYNRCANQLQAARLRIHEIFAQGNAQGKGIEKGEKTQDKSE